MRVRQLGSLDISEYCYRASIERVDQFEAEHEAIVVTDGAQCSAAELVESRKHVLFCAIPTGWKAADFEAMQPLAQEKCVVAGFLERWNSKHLAIKAKMPKLGIPGLVRIHRWEKFDSSGGYHNQIVKDIDLTCWLLDEAPERAYAARPGADDRLTQIHMGFSSGAMALIDYAASVPTSYYSLSVIGSTGAAYADDHHNQQLLFQDGNTLARTIPTDVPGTARLFAEFAAAAAGKRPATPGLAELQTAWKIIDSARLSLETHDVQVI